MGNSFFKKKREDINVKIYRGNRKSALFTGLLFFAILFGITLAQFNENGFSDITRLVILGAFWIAGMIFTAVPLASKLEVGKDYINTYFLSYCMFTIRSADVRQVDYGYFMHTGMSLDIRVNINGKIKRYMISENYHDKRGVAHAKRVLEAQLPKKIKVTNQTAHRVMSKPLGIYRGAYVYGDCRV